MYPMESQSEKKIVALKKITPIFNFTEKTYCFFCFIKKKIIYNIFLKCLTKIETDSILYNLRDDVGRNTI